MPKENSGVKFYLKSPKQKTSSIKAVFYYNYLRFTYTEPKLGIDTQYWNSKDQRARNTKQFPGSAKLNHSLDLIESVIVESFREYVNQNSAQPSLLELSELVKQRRGRGGINDKNQIGLFEFIEEFIENAKNGIHLNLSTGKPVTYVTIRTYEQTLRVLKAFSSKKHRKIGFDDIDIPFYSQFVYFLTNEYKSEVNGNSYKINTVGKHITNLKTFMQNAVDKKITTNTSYKAKSFKVVHEAVDKIYLTQIEIDSIYKFDLSKNKKLDNARDIFIIGCETGLRISDLKRLCEENIIEDEGDRFIRIEMRKTEKSVTIPISSRVEEIFVKYKKHTENIFPKAISDQKMNEYIKEIASKIDILKDTVSFTTTINDKRVSVSKAKFELISNHTARRSFATNAVIRGIPRTMVMAMTGHKTEKSFNRYIRMDELEIAKQFKIENDKGNMLRAV